jgi:hypothetical protein
MSVSNVTGKLAFAMMVALGLGLAAGAGGCVVASGTGDETQGEKTEQASTATDHEGVSEATSAAASADDGTNTQSKTSQGPVGTDPEPLPWISGNTAVRGNVTAKKNPSLTPE